MKKGKHKPSLAGPEPASPSPEELRKIALYPRRGTGSAPQGKEPVSRRFEDEEGPAWDQEERRWTEENPQDDEPGEAT